MTMLADGQTGLSHGGLVNYPESSTRPPKHSLTVPLIVAGGRTLTVRIVALQDDGDTIDIEVDGAQQKLRNTEKFDHWRVE